jgi:heme-degrading monooxygenase HmoA
MVMHQANIELYRVKPGTADEVIHRVVAGLALVYRNQPGFVAYELIKTCDEGLVSLSVWNRAEQAEVAAMRAAAWQRQHLGDMVTGVEHRVGAVAFFWDLAGIGR